jgi:hypothetical protein
VANRAQVLLSLGKGLVSLLPQVLVIGRFLVQVVDDVALSGTNAIHVLIFHEQAIF